MLKRSAHVVPWIGGFATVVLFVVALAYLDRIEVRSARNLDEQVLRSTLDDYGARLSSQLSVRMQLAAGLGAVVRSDPDFATRNFEAIADGLVGDLAGVLSLQLAPGGVVRYVTDPERNAAVLGRDLLAAENDAATALESIRTGSMLIQGPFELAQGGVGVVARLPIFTGGVTAGQDGFWGFSTVVLNVDDIVAASGLNDLPEGMLFALEGERRASSDQLLVIGSGTAFAEGVVRSVSVPNGTWSLALSREGGLPVELMSWRPRLWGLGLVATLFAAASIFFLLRQPLTLRAAVDRATADLKDANEATEQALRVAELSAEAKTRLMRRVSHEFRTPLNAIIGFSEVLVDRGDPLSESQERLVGHVLTSGRHLLGMVDQILELGAVERGEQREKIAAMLPGPEIDACIEILGAEAERKHVTIRNGVTHAASTRVLARPISFKQVVMNLLANAVKFNRDHGEVSIRDAVTPGGHWRLEVRDSGPGLTEEEQSKVFEPFERLTAEAAGHPGSGLGLAIAHESVQGMHGTLGVDSVPGEGSTFWVELPLAEDAMASSTETPRVSAARP